MVFEHGSLEVLDGVCLAVQVALLLELVGDGIALLGQPSVLLPVLAEPAADGLACLRKEVCVGRARLLAGRAAGIFLLVEKCAEQRKEHVIGRRVFGVQLEHRALEVLHRVGLAVGVRDLLHLARDRIALLGQAAVRVPVLQELAAYGLARSLVGAAVRLCVYSPV